MNIRYRMIGFDVFYKSFKESRAIWLAGQKGTGKSLFSVALSYELLRRGKVLKAGFNFPVSFGSAPSRRRCIVTLDEAGQAFTNRFTSRDKVASAFITEATAILRKYGSYLIFPSHATPDMKLREMRMWRYRKIGNHFWLYHWEYGEENPELRTKLNFRQGKLTLFNPSAFFGVYDTYFWPKPELTQDFLRQFLTVDTEERLS